MIKFKWIYNNDEINFGPSSIQELKNYLKDNMKVIIVTGKMSAKLSGALDDTIKILKENGVSYYIFDNVSPNPLSSQADELAKMIISYNPNAIIAIGGGSVIDTAKLGAATAANGGKTVDYLYGKRKVEKIIPIYAINLTHGTGSEANRYANTTDTERGDKLGNAICYPKAAFDDPKYTLSMPKEEVLCTTFDAFYHAYESSTTSNSPPLVHMLSLEVVNQIKENLPLAIQKLDDINPRYYLLYASMLAGVSIDLSPTNIIHALENIMSGLVPSLPHGCGLALIGPLLAPLIHKSSPNESTKILKILNPNIKPNSDDSLITKTLIEFHSSVGFNKKLSDYGFGRDMLRESIRRAFANPVVVDRLKNRLYGTNIDEKILINLLENSL
ncbi:alcohol dehydrogenase, class IV [Caldisphaera lagunensis DSM 15908]|uniref:Alcohol dehydrogenase, class IV n=1 Tax=Caldisphaera lagunensis (strain DSM 15908 / JCM 11604 / ANMR 0165 / IC-154) TaxID=1056495 RepID=L0AA40_CALLD|nr:iron-containing alcohol dehydrogenase [Caldisphaera lagunensis]AFZ70289.1 alcohol dehydrogenase, class IV [Caldisphaera lagunensis DSM 15908]